MKLTEQIILERSRVIFTKKLIEIATRMKIDGLDKNVISNGLKIKHKKSGFLYTVASINIDDIELKTPEGTEFLIDKKTLENDYEIA